MCPDNNASEEVKLSNPNATQGMRFTHHDKTLCFVSHFPNYLFSAESLGIVSLYFLHSRHEFQA